jgi:hypothetical protein
MRFSMLQRAFSPRDSGFVIPLALGIGLILLLVGTITIIRTQTDKRSSFAKKVSARSLNAAETGISRVRALLGRYPEYAGSNLGAWLTVVSCLSDKSPIIRAKNKTWEEIEPSQPSRGQYRVSGYQYDAVTGQGVLVVDGRINQDDLGESITSVEVTIPVRPPLLSDAMPGLRLFTNSPSGMEDEKVKGDIALNTCAIPGQGPNDKNIENTAPPQFQLILHNRPVPTLSIPNSTAISLPPGSLFPNSILPRPGDTPDVDGRYKYRIQDLQYNSDSGAAKIEINPGAKIDLFVQDNIVLEGDEDININTGGQANQLRIIGSNSTGSVRFSSSGTIRAFIFAPNAVATVEDGGKQNKPAKKPKKGISPVSPPSPAPGGFNYNGIVGSLWVRDWNKTKPYPGSETRVFAEGSFRDYGFTENELGHNKISSVSIWNRAKVNK